jgi:hypothetical protein
MLLAKRRDGMVQDLSLARDMQSAFEEWLKSQPEAKRPRVDLNVTVLTTGFWCAGMRTSQLMSWMGMVTFRSFIGTGLI